MADQNHRNPVLAYLSDQFENLSRFLDTKRSRGLVADQPRSRAYARLVVVTLGEQGTFGAGRGIHTRVTAPSVDVVDTIGAGDAFGAALLAWLHDHRALKTDLALDAADFESALQFACLVASLMCTRAGAEPPRRAALAG
jgi:sugar/nucleoside kinase (ribokinase family)